MTFESMSSPGQRKKPASPASIWKQVGQEPVMCRPFVLEMAPNPIGRDFAVGDIHGCFSDLQRSLDHIGFDPAKDRLFSVGDLVDRGPESDHVMEWLDKPWFHAVLGNHEEMVWRSFHNRPLDRVDHRDYGGEWFFDLDPDRQRAIADRFAGLPLSIELQTGSGKIGIVHSDCPFDDWRDFRSAIDQPNERLPFVIASCLWSSDRFNMDYAIKAKNVRALIHGHMTIRAMKTLGNAFYIDTGGWKPQGRFTFLNMQSLKTLSGPVNSWVL